MTGTTENIPKEKTKDEIEEEEKRLNELSSKAGQVIEVMEGNIEKAISRGENLGDLEAQTKDLEAQSKSFKRKAVAVKWKLRMKLFILSFGICIAIGIVILIILRSLHII
eukprot:GHVP01070863.1.p1 GENE.GHVP01070863.1~~GHVP01070863.1.p1  ORF type:complete len:110 (-),score=20.91 GHVP01070863.1:622-951(-)